ncbi:MAG TPA: sn-glycerol-3-phosphate ABC transporter ATP-binding protein UgpC [Firmicutes bacterium]|nr:sn-glycerol-3-phosphate ABC transporter ATP-binding protein UgpC [Bacillota bacterium]
MAQVILKNISKIFGNDIYAVKDFNLEIQDKEFIVIVGPSGCGKSTTLRMVAGLEDISAGEIVIGDKVVNDISPKDRDIAMVFQNYALYPHMTVYENMAFGLKLRKFPKDEIDNRVKEAAAILEIGHLLERRPKELSGGQRQRVAVGRAIVRKPAVFLFDEPLSNLDAKLRVQMRAEIQKLHSTLQTTMIYVTHDQVEAMTMGDRIIVMKDGLIQQVDDPIHLYNNPVNKFVAGFIGSPSMNFIKGKIEKREGELFFKYASMKLKLPENFNEKLQKYIDKEVFLGIRPEDIYDKVFIAQPKEGTVFRAIVEVIEPMGNEIFLYLKIGGLSIIARVSPQTNVKINQEMELVVNISKTHVFDLETENLII